MKLSDGEKLILVMLSEIYEHLKIEGDIDPKFVKAAIHSGNLWGLEWQMTGIFHGHEASPEIVREVGDVLTMWAAIELSYQQLSSEDKARIETEAAPFGKHVRFTGFDGNNESTHMSVARFLVDELDRFSQFKGRDLNSHSPSLAAYERMRNVYEPLNHPQFLSATQIIAILKEQLHPDLRPSTA